MIYHTQLRSRVGNKEKITEECITECLFLKRHCFSKGEKKKKKWITEAFFSCGEIQVLELQETSWAIWKANTALHTRRSVSYAEPTRRHDCKSKREGEMLLVTKERAVNMFADSEGGQRLRAGNQTRFEWRTRCTACVGGSTKREQNIYESYQRASGDKTHLRKFPPPDTEWIHTPVLPPLLDSSIFLGVSGSSASGLLSMTRLRPPDGVHLSW